MNILNYIVYVSVARLKLIYIRLNSSYYDEFFKLDIFSKEKQASYKPGARWSAPPPPQVSDETPHTGPSFQSQATSSSTGPSKLISFHISIARFTKVKASLLLIILPAVSRKSQGAEEIAQSHRTMKYRESTANQQHSSVSFVVMTRATLSLTASRRGLMLP